MRGAARAIGLDADPHAVGFYEHMGAKVIGEAPSGSIPGRMLPRMEDDDRESGKFGRKLKLWPKIAFLGLGNMGIAWRAD